MEELFSFLRLSLFYFYHSKPDCLDVAIVGGGIGGTYTAYRLRNKGQRISLFEFSDRIGGRMFTAKIPTVEGETVDFGAMRFLPEAHTSLVNILNEVELNIVDFPQNFGNRNETVYYLRGQHLKTEELGGPRTPYNLRPEERLLSPNDLKWKLFTENTNMSRKRFPPDEEELYSICTTDGVPLFTLTLDDFYSRFASREAYNYISDTNVFSFGEFGALLGLNQLVFPGQNGFPDVKTIEGGFSRLPRRLLSRFLRTSKRHRLQMNHHLVAMEGHSGNYRLRFMIREPGQGYKNSFVPPENVICARKVVLALQRDSVARINFRPFRNPYFRQKLNSVIDVHAEKIFLAYPNAWWKEGNENITHARSELQSGTTYDWRKGTNGLVIHLSSYNDGKSNVALWRQLQGQGSTISGSLPGEQRVTTAVRDRIHRFMSRIYRIPESDIPSTVGGGMQLWDRFPFEASWHFYKPGVKMSETRDLILKPFSNHEVFIASNSWMPNTLQAWSEGTLRMVELLLERFLW